MTATKRIGLMASAAMFILPATSAWAQAEAESRGPAAEEASEVSGDIIVTARKTEETLHETPIAVSVITGELLDKTGFVEVGQVARFVPGFSLTPLNTTRATGSKIRGISTFSFSDGFESSVATVIDGIVMGREAQGFFDFVDVESIEIIKGPQGTLFGKNASAGVVNIRTRDPEFEFGGRGDVTFGRFNQLKVRGTVTGPLVDDKIAIRLTGSLNQRNGVLKNAIPGEKDLNDKDTFSFRGKLLFTPNENLTVRLTGDYVEEDNHCCLPTFRTSGPFSGAVAFAQNPGVLQITPALTALGVTASPSNRKVPVLYNNIRQKSRAGGVASNIEYDFGDVALTSITGWRDWRINEFNEADGISTSNVNNRNGTAAQADQFSQELRLDGKIGDRLNFVTGLYYFHQNLAAQGRVNIEFALPFPPFFNVSTSANRTVKNDSSAIFGEATLNITDRLSLIAGARYSHEKISATYTRIATPIIPARPFGAFFGPNVTGAQTVKDNNLSGRVIGRYFWTDNLMTYVSWSRGYKGPGIDVAESVNVAAIATPGGLPVLPPEIPTLWEAGVRAELFDKTLSANITFYSQNVRNLQTISTDALGVTTNLSITKLQSRGIEADLVLAPRILQGFTLTGSFTLNDIKIDKFTARPDLEGLRFRDNPKYFYSAVGDYRSKLFGSDYEGFMRAEWTWQSGKFSSLNLAPFSRQGSYGLLNLRVGFDAPDKRFGVTFAVENVANKDYAHFIFGSSYGVLDGNRTTSQFLGDPRTWSVTLRGKF